MFNTIVGIGAGAASRYGSGSDQKMRLLPAPALQHCLEHCFFPVLAVTELPVSALNFDVCCSGASQSGGEAEAVRDGAGAEHQAEAGQSQAGQGEAGGDALRETRRTYQVQLS
jgi:hypothetical protein